MGHKHHTHQHGQMEELFDRDRRGLVLDLVTMYLSEWNKIDKSQSTCILETLKMKDKNINVVIMKKDSV